ncbi:pyruvate formate lyase family protein [Chloroflexota bacterium]
MVTEVKTRPVKKEEKIVPWWERSKSYGKMWRGSLFDRMTLQGYDEEEQRIQKLREMLLERPEGGRGYLSIWRAKLMTESYKQTDGEPAILRKAKAFKHVCEHIPLLCNKYQLLLGDPSAYLLGTEVEQEFMSAWMERPIFVEEVNKTMPEIDALKVRGVESWLIDNDDYRALKEEIIPYWRDICHPSVIQKQLEENFPQVGFKNGHFPGKISHPLIGFGVCHTVCDYVSTLRKGMKGLKAEIQAEMDKIDAADIPSNTELDRYNIYKGMQIAADGMIIYANRCADLAEEEAAKETDAKRKAELTEMARVCRKVPENPAESWWEAIQSWHFLHNSVHLCDAGDAHSAGRFDQYMYPFLTKDLESGKTSKKLAQTLLECLFIKIRQRKYLQEYHRSKRMPSFSTNDKMAISGMDVNGQDATNELSWMMLEAHCHVHLNDPSISFRMHKNTPDDILKAVLEALRLSTGIPHIINDEAIIPSLMNRGVPLAEARNYADLGCQENVTDPNTSGADTNPRANAGYYNLTKLIHLAMYNGTEKMSGEKAGVETGDPKKFKTMEEFFAAVKEQTEYTVHLNCIYNNLMDWAWKNWHPVPVLDLLHPGPRSKGIDYNDGGCKHNWTGGIGVGLGSAADSLTAIEYLIYDKKEVTWDQLMEALDNNWVGYEDLREKCRKAPKYGNDDDYADKWAVMLSNAWMDAYEKHRTVHGGIFVGGFFSIANYAYMGHDTWATPEGRAKGEPLSAAIDPSVGVDLEGPTKLHKSAAKLDTWRATNGVLFNCRFTTAAVAGERELSKWADLVRTYILLRGQTVQYTVVDTDAMLDAQKHPDEYKDLIVRVGGYSAIFVELAKEIQDTIIARTEHKV